MIDVTTSNTQYDDESLPPYINIQPSLMQIVYMVLEAKKVQEIVQGNNKFDKCCLQLTIWKNTRKSSITTYSTNAKSYISSCVFRYLESIENK